MVKILETKTPGVKQKKVACGACDASAYTDQTQWHHKSLTYEWMDSDVIVHDCPNVSLDTPCLLWSWTRDGKGYAQVPSDGKYRLVSRLLLGIVGRRDLIVMPLCGNPPCVNIKHLKAGTRQEQADNKSRQENKTRRRVYR